jgi:hypothetical protein
MPFPLARGAEGLAGARACPNRSVIGPAGESQGVGPSADAGEEVALSVSIEILGRQVAHVARIDAAGRDVFGRDEVAQPLGAIAVVVAVERRRVHAFGPRRYAAFGEPFELAAGM